MKVRFSRWIKDEELRVYVRKTIIPDTNPIDLYNHIAHGLNTSAEISEAADEKPHEYIAKNSPIYKIRGYKAGTSYYEFYRDYDRSSYFYIDNVKACIRIADHPFDMSVWIKENPDCLMGISVVAGYQEINFGERYKEWISHDTDAVNKTGRCVTVYEYVVEQESLGKLRLLKSIASTLSAFIGHSGLRPSARFGFRGERVKYPVIDYIQGQPIGGNKEVKMTKRTNYPDGLNEDMDSMLGDDPMVAQQNIDQARKKMDREVERKFPQYWEAERYYKPAYQKIWDSRGSYDGKDDEIVHEAVGKFAEKLGLKWDWIRDPYYLFGFYPANANKNDMQIKVPYDFKFTNVHTKCIQWFRNQVKKYSKETVQKKGIRLCESHRPTVPKYPQDDNGLYDWLMGLYDDTMKRDNNFKRGLWASNKFLREMFNGDIPVRIVIAELYNHQADSEAIVNNTQFNPYDPEFREEALRYISMSEYRKPLVYSVHLQVSRYEVEEEPEKLFFLKDKKSGFIHRIVPIDDSDTVYDASEYQPYVRSLMEEFVDYVVKSTHGHDEVRDYLFGGEFFQRVSYIGTCWYDG